MSEIPVTPGGFLGNFPDMRGKVPDGKAGQTPLRDSSGNTRRIIAQAVEKPEVVATKSLQ